MQKDPERKLAKTRERTRPVGALRDQPTEKPLASTGSRDKKVKLGKTMNMTSVIDPSTVFDGFPGLGSALQKVRDEIYPNIQKGLEFINDLENTNGKDFKLMSKNGWFPDFSLSVGELFDQVNQYQSTHTSKGEQCADAEITEHFEGVMDEFLLGVDSTLCKRRTDIVKEAINAHKSGSFSLSAPIFLIQADGHCASAYNAPVWGVPKKNRAMTIASEKYDENQFIGAALIPFFEGHQPLMAGPGQRKADFPFHIINRHMVLHGESLDYGTRENSARAFSFLWYCMYLIDCFFEEQSEGQDSEG